MNKEKTTDILLAYLTETIWRDIDENSPSKNDSPFVYFLSMKEIQIFQKEESLPTNKFYESNPLKKALEAIIKMYYYSEEKHWLEIWNTDTPDNNYSDIEEIYTTSFCSDHIYHKLRFLKDFLSL